MVIILMRLTSQLHIELWKQLAYFRWKCFSSPVHRCDLLSMQEMARKNAANRAKLRMNHSLGTKSLARKRDELVWFTQSIIDCIFNCKSTYYMYLLVGNKRWSEI
jgi:hypothetical protein